MPYDPRRGGHAPDDLRNEFGGLLDRAAGRRKSAKRDRLIRLRAALEDADCGYSNACAARRVKTTLLGRNFS